MEGTSHNTLWAYRIDRIENGYPVAVDKDGNDLVTVSYTHLRDAVWWKDACLLYFQQFSKQPIPYELERPVHELKDIFSNHKDGRCLPEL